MKAVVLFGHGSRDPQWRLPMDAVAQRLRAQGVAVRCAFLELQGPGLPAAVAELARDGATAITVLPMFLGAGRHAREDLPRLVADARAAHPGIAFDVRPAVGEDARLLDLLARLALE